MSPEGLQRTLVDLGWISLLQRVLDGRPAESFALRQLMTRAGRVVTYTDLAQAYAERARSDAYGAKPRLNGATTTDAVRTRIQRLRRNLEDLGIPAAAIQNVQGEGYIMTPDFVPLVERTILAACGVEVGDEP